MKIYVIIGSNKDEYGTDHEWTDAVFISRESAEKYIQEKRDSFAKDNARLTDLLYGIEDLTISEVDERYRLMSKWHYDWDVCPDFRIEEYDAQI